jgi:hypothetical protein
MKDGIEQLSLEAVLEFVKIINSADPVQFYKWWEQHDFSKEKIEEFVGLVIVHTHNLDYLESHAPGSPDFEKEIEEFEESIPYLTALIHNQPLIASGSRKIESDKKRSRSMKKKTNDCPVDHFKLDIVNEAISFLTEPKVSEIGLFLTCGPHDFELTRFSASSLKEAFASATGITIANRTWQKWTKRPTKSKITRYNNRFDKFLPKPVK